MARLIDKGTREYTCALIMMFFGSLAAFGAEYCLQPVIPILAQDFNLTPTQASLSMSFGTIGMAFSMLLIASISKHLERKKVMVIADFFYIDIVDVNYRRICIDFGFAFCTGNFIGRFSFFSCSLYK